MCREVPIFYGKGDVNPKAMEERGIGLTRSYDCSTELGGYSDFNKRPWAGAVSKKKHGKLRSVLVGPDFISFPLPDRLLDPIRKPSRRQRQKQSFFFHVLGDGIAQFATVRSCWFSTKPHFST